MSTNWVQIKGSKNMRRPQYMRVRTVSPLNVLKGIAHRFLMGMIAELEVLMNAINKTPDKKEIISFLKEALAYSWPNNVGPTTKPDLAGFKESHFSRGRWDYIDLWGGGLTDLGFELIFYDKVMLWGAVYRGGIIGRGGRGVLDDEFGSNQVFTVLAEALQAPSDNEIPLRGPSVYVTENGWVYRFRLSGQFSSFIAIEEIHFGSSIAYQRVFTGGYIGDDSLYGFPISANNLFGQVM